MFGKINLENFTGLTSMPQKAASAWTVLDNLVGASYKPLLYVGKRVVRGVNHIFIAEQTLVTNPPARHLVMLEINEFAGKFELVPSSIVEIA